VPEQYTNRRDDTYYLLQGKTKTGKPKYYCSKKPTGVTVDAMPAGYEWRESPDTAIVTVRKIRPTCVLPNEKELLADGIRQLAGLKVFIIDLIEMGMVVYLPDRNLDALDQVLGEILGPAAARDGSMIEWTIKHTQYCPMMRFLLCDENKRLYCAERWCFLGAIDDWILLSKALPLPQLIKTFVPHLGQESFFELN
jgi:hypothetical protein